MKIHGKTRDYYDNADVWQSEVHWARPKNEVITIQKRYYEYDWNLFSTLKLDTDTDKIIIVGFCGELHMCIQRHIPAYTTMHGYDPSITKFIYLDVDVTKTLKLKIDLYKFFEDRPYFSISLGRFSETILETCPVLRDIEFFKVKDTYTAHQQIEQYLTNELANQQDGTDLKETEQQILERHGMNKCSFKGKHTGRKLKR